MCDPAAIANSRPLICLARISHIELLPRLFSNILVPPEVWNEVTGGPQALNYNICLKHQLQVMPEQN